MSLTIGVALLATPFLTRPAFAGVEISPILLNLSPRERVATLIFKNGDDRAVRLVAEVKERSQPDGHNEALADTEDLIVNPPISQVPPGKAQIFRVSLRRPVPLGTERAYRLVITDVTPVVPDAGGVPTIAFRLSHQIPLYVNTVPGGRPSLTLEKCDAAKKGFLCAQMFNRGQIHAQIRSVTFSSGTWSTVAKQRGAILAGGSLCFFVPQPEGLTAKASITVTADVDGQGTPVSRSFDSFLP